MHSAVQYVSNVECFFADFYTLDVVANGEAQIGVIALSAEKKVSQIRATSKLFVVKPANLLSI